MRVSQRLSLVGFLLFFFFPAHPCEICEADDEQQASLASLMATMIEPEQPFPEVDPSILIALKLARQNDEKAEKTFLNQVKQNIMQREILTSGQLALNMLALTAACQKDVVHDYKLVKKLEEKFQKEVDSIDTSGHPLTNYYELGLDVLALCLLNGTYSSSKIAKLFSAEQMKIYIGGRFSVDTGAISVLALTCVNRQNPDEMIGSNILWLVDKILKEKKQDDTIGNIYSTGEAMQALFVTPEYYEEGDWDCKKTLKKVLNQIPQGTFRLPIAAAQVLPALEGKTYLDLTHVSCQSLPGHLNTSTPKPAEPTHQSNETISVTYRVVDSINNNINESTIVSVPEGSVFLKVMEAAQTENKAKFGFKIKQTQWGPYVTSVHGIEASSKNRTYWELLSNGQSLTEGAGSFVVSDGDNLEVRLSKY
ncbi:transcobalamin-1 [Trichosurus vulpecula]|uniref:transcobalamin-1 n=1 Tax=Trichosurus vulpecula TaxID=9337 RepID=UPI00186AFC1B|nr:transcobalamin-1 [Trichosurus vulpecula]